MRAEKEHSWRIPVERAAKKRKDQRALLSAQQLMGVSDMNLRHHSLVAWQRADDLFIKLHKTSLKKFPAFERFELGSQLRKAAYSVPANIAEGFGRRHTKERLQFLTIAQASLAEVAYCIHAASRLGYIDAELLSELENDQNAAGAPLAGLLRSVASGKL